jgi:hypothetical protein
MKDSTTKKPIRVSAYGDAVPFVEVTVSQLPEVQALLDKHHVRYWVDEDAISLNGEPEVTVINLSRGTDPAAVQRILDDAP